MKNIRSILIVSILSTLILSSCSSANDMTEREQSLFVQAYQILPIPIDKLDNLNDLLLYFDSTYCVNREEKWPYTYLDMKQRKLVSTKNKNTLKIGIEPNPCQDKVIKFDDTMILEIVKDGHNTTIENYFTEVDSIPSFVRKQFLSFGEDPNYAVGGLGNGVWLCTKKADKLENLNIYIYNIVKGFIKSVREYSKLAYGKSIDELSEEEFEEISQEFVFHLSFKYTDEEPTIMLDI